MSVVLFAIIITLGIYSILISSSVTVLGNQSNSINSSVSNSFGDDLRYKIQDLVSDALNETSNILNSNSIDTYNKILNSSFIPNGSNQTSSNIIISNNKVISSVNNSGSDGSSSSLVKNQIKTINGVCTSIKIGGNGNDTLASSGSCNDELTGGPGADKFQCGEGNDTIKDYNPEEGDTILDRQDCETIL